MIWGKHGFEWQETEGSECSGRVAGDKACPVSAGAVLDLQRQPSHFTLHAQVSEVAPHAGSSRVDATGHSNAAEAPLKTRSCPCVRPGSGRGEAN